MINPESLKGHIRNLSKEKNIPAQVVLQNFVFERLMVRLSRSMYKENFIIKGGVLVAAIVGLDNRATMDLDTTIKNYPLSKESITSALIDIFAIDCNDGISYEIYSVVPIRDDDIYGGFRFSIKAKLDYIITPFSIDISTGDVITPNPEAREFSEMFDSKSKYELFTYNIETIIAEKIETILRRGVFNTRPRDFYDCYILITQQKINKSIFDEALHATSIHRKSLVQIEDKGKILYKIEHSSELQALWKKYANQFAYAKTIEYSEIISAIKSLVVT